MVIVGVRTSSFMVATILNSLRIHVYFRLFLAAFALSSFILKVGSAIRNPKRQQQEWLFLTT
jgi:hypothetical protein